ncbi:MAG: Maf family protein [Spirochaetaceae bacterium]
MSTSDRSDSLVLASSSPRRHEILTRLGLPFETVHPFPDDDPADHRPAEQFARELAERKARSVADQPAYRHRLVLGADTVVADDRGILLKPADRRDARRMLIRLSGATHRVVTALALVGGSGRARVEATSTAVTFAALSEVEIEWYLDTGEWQGVAGAYRIQERGEALVERVAGPYSAVVGLPIRLLCSMLWHTGYPCFSHR